jgi:hypothetical protein
MPTWDISASALDGVYVDGVNGTATRFQWVKAPTNTDLTRLAHTIAR